MDKNRYIVLLDSQIESAVNKVENEFAISVTSSEDLSKTNRSFDIIDNTHGVLYKNLGIVVVDNVDEEHLKIALREKNNPIVYYEKEREFFAVDEFMLLNDLKANVESSLEKMVELEKLLKEKSEIESALIEFEWGLKAIGVNNSQYSGSGIDVCILDTGFDTSHPDFADRDIVGKSFVEGENWDTDPNGHGTHCSGTACGNVRTDTGKRYGVAHESNIKIGKVLSNSGRGTSSSLIDAIDWAITKQFRVISMSLASPVKINEKPSILFETVGKRALDNNCLIIAAAGNDSKRPAMPIPVSAPANCQSIMAIAALDGLLRVARFSNGGINASTGGNINVSAPGVDILSSHSQKNRNGDRYKVSSGTSMATPHVSGLAALYMEQFPNLNAREIWELLESNAKELEGQKYRDVGKGLVQVIS